VKFACKQLKLNRATPRYVSKLYHEVSIMRELNHPHIIKLHEVYYARRQIYLIMEVARGGEVFDLLTSQAGDHFSEPFAAELMIQMLSAVHYMHSRGVVHRDLKLENFLLEEKLDPRLWAVGRDGGNKGLSPPAGAPPPCVKLIDFGLSKHMAPHEIMAQQVGSAYYVAPEVLRGSYTEACDLWSMGVILYMLVSGIPPFWGGSDAEIRQRILVGKWGFPEVQFAHVSSECKDLIQRLLTADPGQRLTAQQALQHPWIKNAQTQRAPAPVERARLKRQVSFSMGKFVDFSSMRKLMLEVVAFSLKPEEIAEMREAFEEMDTDRSGTLTLQELQSALGDRLSADEVAKIFESADVHHGHTINYNEFIAATTWERIHLDEENIHQMFDLLDPQRQGFLSIETLQNAVGQDFSSQDVAAMMRECDTDGDGQIDYHEFERLWKQYQVEAHKECLGDLHDHFHQHKHFHQHEDGTWSESEDEEEAPQKIPRNEAQMKD